MHTATAIPEIWKKSAMYRNTGKLDVMREGREKWGEEGEEQSIVWAGRGQVGREWVS